jgi:nitrite reductase/ring-hydroxylating ferredoxin subunit
MGEFVRVAGTSDLADGEIMPVDVGGEVVLLSRLDGTFYAVGEACSHAQGPLADGYVQGDEVECPWHGSRFSLRTGKPTCPPATEPVPAFNVRVDGDDVLVDRG